MSTALDPLKVDPQDYKLELGNSQVRGAPIRVGPRRSVPMHEYAVNHVVVYVTDENVRRVPCRRERPRSYSTRWGIHLERPLQT